MKRCCVCKAKRPDPAGRATKEGWRGCRVYKRGEKSHWICPLHSRELHDVMQHAEDVADGKTACAVVL